MARKSPWEKEWAHLLKREARYKSKRVDGPTSVLLMKLDRFIPEKLSGTLSVAFFKALQVIFEKGTRLIELTYNRAKRQADFKVNKFANEMYGDSRSARSFTREARGTRLFNLIISFVEGVALGLLGLGIPDIPLFMAIVLKGVYEVALSYGYDYHDENEKIFILKVIEVAMTDDEELEHIQGGSDETDVGFSRKGNDIYQIRSGIHHPWRFRRNIRSGVRKQDHKLCDHQIQKKIPGYTPERSTRCRGVIQKQCFLQWRDLSPPYMSS